MSVKNCHHVTEKAGLKSTLGRSGHRQTSVANRINAISKHCKSMLDLCKLGHFCLQRRSREPKFQKFVRKGKIIL